MPVYEYRCSRGHHFERVVPVSADEPKELVRCPEDAADGHTCFRLAKLVPSAPGPMYLKAGIGGFHKPNA